jgi:hypothetical protein
MANNYSQFSEVIFPNLTEEEIDWIDNVTGLDYIDDAETLDSEFPGWDKEEPWPGCQCEITKEGTLWISAEESFGDTNLTLFLQAFLKEFRPKDAVTISISHFCDKLRAGEYGAGWMAITATEARGGSTWDAAQRAVVEMLWEKIDEKNV